MLEAREERETAESIADDRWLLERNGVDPDERRVAWRRWLRRKLLVTLHWPQSEPARDKLIGQCMAEITTLVCQLRGRGWLLDAKALAEHVNDLLEPIAKAQKAGSVREFWPFFRHVVRTYVGSHAEEIQAHARRTGSDEGSLSMASALSALGIGRAIAKAPSMTEIVAEPKAKALAERRRKQQEDKAQLKLIDLP